MEKNVIHVREYTKRVRNVCPECGACACGKCYVLWTRECRHCGKKIVPQKEVQYWNNPWRACED